MSEMAQKDQTPDLDDYFARKDKKKGKSKKLTLGEELAKRIEDTSKASQSQSIKKIDHLPIQDDGANVDEVIMSM